MLQKKILFNITEDWFFLSHFLSRALSAQKDGFEKSSENNVLEMGLTYSKSSGNMSSNIEKERKNDYSDPETI